MVVYKHRRVCLHVKMKLKDKEKNIKNTIIRTLSIGCTFVVVASFSYFYAERANAQSFNPIYNCRMHCTQTGLSTVTAVDVNFVTYNQTPYFYANQILGTFDSSFGQARCEHIAKRHGCAYTTAVMSFPGPVISYFRCRQIDVYFTPLVGQQAASVVRCG
jgi:hypothetical protein